jgi:hypothetical protein
MAKWKREILKLQENHGWKAKPGYKIFVADRGAVRFDFPEDWVFIPGKDSMKFHDRQPPDDDCLLQVSVIHLHPRIDWSRLPLAQLLEAAIEGDSRGVTSTRPLTRVERPDLELVWTETSFIDPVERREARSRTCLARGSNVQPLITMDFWPEHAARFVPVWDEVLRTLVLGDYVEDPTRRTLQ